MALPIQGGRGMGPAAAQGGKFNDLRQSVYQQSPPMQYNVRMQQNSQQPMTGTLNRISTPNTGGQFMRPSIAKHSSPSVPIGSPLGITMPQQQNSDIKAGTSTSTPLQQPIKRDSRSARRKKKLADRILSQKIRDVVPESKAYIDLLDFERRLDTVVMRKRLDIQEALKRPIKEKRTLRLFISHDFIMDDTTVPSWEMKIEGKILDNQNQGKGSKRKLSSFFKSLLIELDKDLYGPDNHIIEWHRSSASNDTAGFQIKRPGDTAVQCTIILNLDNQIPQYKLDARLSRLLGIHTQTRAVIVNALWQYIRVHKLQDQNEREIINNDKYLQQIFEVSRMKFNEIPQRLNGLLHPPDPVIIKYCISPNTPEEKSTTCCDVEVEVDDTLREQMQSFLLSTQSQQEISQLDDKACSQIGTIVQAINELKVKREFMVNFANDPQAFIHEWLLSQCRDLKIMEGIAGNYEDERKSKYYYQSWTQEAVCRYLYSKVQERRVELETALGIRS